MNDDLAYDKIHLAIMAIDKAARKIFEFVVHEQ